MQNLTVPFHRPSIGDAEIREVVDTLRSGWLTTGSRAARFEESFAASVGAAHAVALNSCTAALHLAIEALGVEPGDAVLVPTMTFAATAEVVRYLGALPILVDCDPVTANVDLDDAGRKIDAAASGELGPGIPAGTRTVGLIAVHVGGLMIDVAALANFARSRGLWVVEDAAHAFPAAWRSGSGAQWRRCGEDTASVTCFSFYANKTITTGEGGMATTADASLAERMRLMSLHGLSHDAWQRYSGGRAWDYRILAPGFKYNMTDTAAALGIHQLARAEAMRLERSDVARAYVDGLGDVEELELPPDDSDRIHAWHLFPLRLDLAKLAIDRNAFVDELKDAGVGCSVHWRPLHLHPYYASFGWTPEMLPVASTLWKRLVSLPVFPGMGEEEVAHVIGTVRRICRERRVEGASSQALGASRPAGTTM